MYSMIKFKIAFILILSTSFDSPLTSALNENAKPVICEIAGHIWNSTYVFNIDELPKRCEIFSIGKYSFNNDADDTVMFQKDRDVIKTLTDNKKIVYVSVGFNYMNDWPIVFDTPNSSIFEKYVLNPLVDFIEVYRISGITLRFYDLYEANVINIDQKINCLFSSIKNKIPTLNLGLDITPYNLEKFQDPKVFDFSITNHIMDRYIIPFYNLNKCDDDAKKYGVNPITSTVKDLTSLDYVRNIFSCSNIDNSKLYAMMQIFMLKPEPYDTWTLIGSYATYCSGSDPLSSQYCKDSSEALYNQGAYAKQHDFGLWLFQLDTDDYDGCCNCEKFPVSNMVLDGYESIAIKKCPKLDECPTT